MRWAHQPCLRQWMKKIKIFQEVDTSQVSGIYPQPRQLERDLVKSLSCLLLENLFNFRYLLLVSNQSGSNMEIFYVYLI